MDETILQITEKNKNVFKNLFKKTKKTFLFLNSNIVLCTFLSENVVAGIRWEARNKSSKTFNWTEIIFFCSGLQAKNYDLTS